MLRFVKSEINIALFLSLVFLNLTVGTLIFLSSNSVSADDMVVSANAVVTVGGGCTMAATLDLAHNATIPNGTYKGDGIGQTTLKVVCNDPGGYAIYAAGYTGEEIDGTDSTKLIGVDTGEKISTGTYSAGASTSSWSMKLATSGSSFVPNIVSPYSVFSAVPSPYTKVAYLNSSTDYGTGATGSVLTATYAAYISATQAADTYNGKVIFTLVHPANEVPIQEIETASGYIGYYPNTAIYEGSMSTSQGGPVQQLTTSQTSATLLASNFSRDGYGFAGWSDVYDYETNPNAHFYGPNEDIDFEAGTYTGDNPGLSLYAVWVPSAGFFQDATAGVACGSLTQATFTKDSEDESIWSITADLSSISALTDMRDSQTYAIAKLPDGKCWMIENLRIEAEATRGSANEALAQGYSKYSGIGTNYGNFIGLANSENNLIDTNAANSIYSTDGSTEINVSSLDRPAYRIPRYNHINTDSTPSTGTRATSLTESTTYSTTANANIYSYGNYYNWSAAKANTNYFTSVAASNEADTSICPAGWHLPTGRESGDFAALSNSLGGLNDNGIAQRMTTITNPTSTIMRQRFRHFPSNFVYSGDTTYSGNASSRGSRGGYYSSASDIYNGSYYLNIGSDVDPGVYLGKVSTIGVSVRCVSTVGSS